MSGKQKSDFDILGPVKKVEFVDRDKVRPNDYNPNKVTRANLDLLKQSILTNGWTLPIVLRPDYTIIDGFHRWLVAGEEPLKSKLNGKIPVVFVDHDEEAKNIYGTITHNRARGTHLLEPMKAIVTRLLESGKSMEEIEREVGMKKEEVFRLSNFNKEEFLALMAQQEGYSRAEYITRD